MDDVAPGLWAGRDAARPACDRGGLMVEGRDWTRSQFERCPDCGADAAAVADSELGAELLREVAAWGRLLAAVLAGVQPAGWERSAERRAGEHFTVRGIARFVLHEVIHHRDDAARSLKGNPNDQP